MSKGYQAHEFSTSAVQDRQINKEQKIVALADLLHRTFATNANDDVYLTQLGADDFGCSQELKNTVDAFIESDLNIIPADPIERISIVSAALQIQ